MRLLPISRARRARPSGFPVAWATLLAALPACSLVVAGQTECEASADCAEGAICAQGLCVKAPADSGVHDSRQGDGGADAGIPVVSLLLGGSATAVAGQPMTVTVTALDPGKNPVPAYRGTVHFSASGASRALAALPADYAFVAADNGTHAFPVTFKEAVLQILAVADVANLAAQGTLDVAVREGAPAKVAVSGIGTTATAGVASSVTVSVLDASDNPITGFMGSVSFDSSDGAASLPGAHTFVAGEDGSHTFSAGVTLKTAGTQSLTATVTGTGVSLTGNQDGIVVNPAAVAAVSFSQQPADTRIGHGFGLQVALADAFGNVATNATAQVILSIASAPEGASLAGTTMATPSSGLATFSGLSVNKAGTYTLKAAVAGSSIAAASSTFNATCPKGYAGATCTACANGYKPSTQAPGTCVPVCSEVNPCTSPPVDTCSGDTLTLHVNPGSCSASGSDPYYACTYGTTQVDCTKSAQGICFVDRCIENPCIGVTCSNDPPDCDADGVTRNTYLASCVVTGAGTHNCAQVKTPIACLGGQGCVAGACTRAPGMSELVISEVMHAPAGDSVGKRWFELTNVSGAPLNLAGLAVDDGTHSFNLPASSPVPLAAGSTFVFGEVPATYVNAPLIPAAFSIGASGRIRVTAAGTVVDDLSWDAAFPQATGAAMNLSAKFVKPLANLRSFHWCDATTAMSGTGSDHGTPGAPNVDCAQSGTAIADSTSQVDQCLNARPSGIAALPAGSASEPIFGQVSKPGVTDQSIIANDYYPFLEAQIGYGPNGNDDAATWTWHPASWSMAYAPGNSTLDEFTATLVIPVAGQYRWGWRFRLIDDTGKQGPWAYCDNTGLAKSSPVSSMNFPAVTVP